MQYKICGIQFDDSSKTYFFETKEDLLVGDSVVVEAAVGEVLVRVVRESYMEDEENVFLPLKPILRIATDKDRISRERQKNFEKQAMQVFMKAVVKEGKSIKLMDVQSNLRLRKVIFRFITTERLNYKEFATGLSQKLKTTIEFKQVGTRDYAKYVGGLGPCGRPTCCSSWMTSFKQISINMAKNQNLSLAPGVVTGLCNSFLCCLAFENDYYTEMKSKLPDIRSTLYTKEGPARVMKIDIMSDIITVKRKGELLLYKGSELLPQLLTEEEYTIYYESKEQQRV